jgi:hypothetical protein
MLKGEVPSRMVFNARNPLRRNRELWLMPLAMGLGLLVSVAQTERGGPK